MVREDSEQIRAAARARKIEIEQGAWALRDAYETR